MFDIVRTLKETDRVCDFVAIGYQGANFYTHAAIIIKLDSKLYQFHFLDGIELTEVEDDFFHKITETIDSRLLPSFYAYCRRILKNANPKFGFFYSGEYYNKAGEHFSTTNLGERMTCVGFCLNVLKGFLENDYIQYTDWDESSHIDIPNYVLEFAHEHGLNVEDIRGAHRRITPLELISSAFFVDIPIKKVDVDSKIEYVRSNIGYHNINVL